MTLGQESHTDFDLHGIVGIRLLNANTKEVAMVTRQVGPIQKPLNREPDITIEFVETLKPSSGIKLVGLNDAGFTDDAFLVMRSKYKSKAKVQIPFEDIGQKHCHIIVERGLPAIPLLLAIINVTMVAKDTLPLHASAFEYKGIGALATGWAKGGKTETLLAFASHGARYVGDEWVYLSRDGDAMYGIPEPIRLWSWHFEEVPQYKDILKTKDKVKLSALGTMTAISDAITNSGIARNSFPMSFLRRVSSVLKKQLWVQVPPERLFSDPELTATGTLQKVFFVASHESPAFVVEKMDADEIAKRMVFSLQEERIDLLGYYTRFRFAFPDKRNDMIENLEEKELEILRSALKDKETYSVYHPYPIPIVSLYEAINPLFI